MGAELDLYPYIKTDSPWRWVPVFVGPLGFLAIGIGLEARAGSLLSFAAWGGFIALFVLLRVSRGKDGLADAFRTSVRRARSTGGRRQNSRPWLARVLFVTGAAMVVTWIVVRTMAIRDAPGTHGAISISRSLGILMLGLMLVLMGCARPWDLKVVDREASG